MKIKKFNDIQFNEEFDKKRKKEKTILTFESTQAKGLDIKNEYTKLINDPDLTTLDLGVVDDVSDTDISNIKQTYKDSIIRVVDGHYILSVKENFNKDVKTFKMFLEKNK
jgi:hypothetical protein